MLVVRAKLFLCMVAAFLLLAACNQNTDPAPGTITEPAVLPSISPTVAGEGTGATEEVSMFSLSSSAFVEGGFIDEKYTYKLGRQCSGENYSPPLEWKGVPEGTKSLLLTMIDPDGGNWVHWLVVNIPADSSSLAETVNGPAVGIAGHNDFGDFGYGGPCPPSGTHHYVLTLYALDTTLDVNPGVTYQAALPLYKDHVLGKASLTGLKQAR